MKRIYHHYTKWEDWRDGMWRVVPKKEEKDYLQKAIDFTGNAEEYGKWMIKVVNEYKYSCEHNLSDKHTNNRAWVGHCATNLSINCPEYITREAWGYLTKEQQDLANAKADIAINIWRKANEHKTTR